MSLASKQKKIQLLQDRSKMLKKVRDFFDLRDVVEVDCAALNVFPSLDLYIEPMKVFLEEQDLRYLHTSPEYGMKKLLSLGMGDIYQLSHVFRKEEEGRFHQNEFMMIEWYRLHRDLQAFYEEVLELTSLFLGKKEAEILTYKDALIRFARLHPQCDKNEILSTISDLPKEAKDWPKDICLHYIWGTYVQPQLGNKKVTIITEFPKSEGALAQTAVQEEMEVALRFEIYIEGMEIGNGYVELTDVKEHQKRFIQINQKRTQTRKEILPIDTTFLSALEKGLPDCIGIAMGFDRLMMLRHQKDHILDVIP